MQPSFTIVVNGHVLDVALLKRDRRFEQFRLSPQGKDAPCLVLQSNRPLWRRLGLRMRRPDWTVLEGEVTQPKAVERAQGLILAHLEPEGTKPAYPKRIRLTGRRDRQ